MRQKQENRKAKERNIPYSFRTLWKIPGANGQIRTDDLFITSELLYQLSYVGINAVERDVGLGI